MLTKGGHKTAAGTYWNLMDGSRVELKEEGILPGNEKAIYIKAHGALVLAASPVLGLLFAVFLPFIGIAMTLMLVAGKIVDGVTSAAAVSASFGWRPVEAYLTGKRKQAAKARKSEKETEKK
jgi:hypothetical protein